jgi:ABC-type multidrug transport system ATPase subunit
MLEIQNLTRLYTGRQTEIRALDGLDLTVREGLFGLLGPNGAGKTTLMRILAGVLEATAGRVVLDGQEITGHPHRIWPRLGYLPQAFGLYPHLTGRAMLVHLLRLKGVHGDHGLDDLADALLARVNLGAAADRKVQTYSGGMRQRLGIAQAIAGDPRLIIVDEPTAGLDPAERLRLYRLLAGLAADRIVLLSTHLVDDVATLCPRFAVLAAGRLVTSTTPAAARDSLAGTVFEGRIDEARLAIVSREHRVVRAHLVEGRLHVRVRASGEEPPPGFAPAEPTLEDFYLATIGEPG